MLSSSIKVPCSIESAPTRSARLMPSAPWAWTATLLAVEVRGLDDRPRLVLEHLRAEAEADAAVDAAGGRDLDDVDAARDLAADGAAAIVGAVAGAARAQQLLVKFLADAERRIHVAGGRRDRGAGVDDARADRPAAGDGVAEAEGDAVVRAEVADRGEAGVERLARVPGRLVGAQRHAVGEVGELALDPGPVGVEMDVAVDQAGQHEAVGKVDQPRRPPAPARSRPAPPRSARRGR